MTRSGQKVRRTLTVDAERLFLLWTMVNKHRIYNCAYEELERRLPPYEKDGAEWVDQLTEALAAACLDSAYAIKQILHKTVLAEFVDFSASRGGFEQIDKTRAAYRHPETFILKTPEGNDSLQNCGLDIWYGEEDADGHWLGRVILFHGLRRGEMKRLVLGFDRKGMRAKLQIVFFAGAKRFVNLTNIKDFLDANIIGILETLRGDYAAQGHEKMADAITNLLEMKDLPASGSFSYAGKIG